MYGQRSVATKLTVDEKNLICRNSYIHTEKHSIIMRTGEVPYKYESILELGNIHGFTIVCKTF